MENDPKAPRGISERDRASIEAVKLLLESLDGFLALSVRVVDPVEASNAQVPTWVRECVRRLENTVFAGPNSTVRDGEFSAYHFGYAIGMTRWGANEMTTPASPALTRIARTRRLSPKARRTIGKLVRTFALKHGLFPWLGRPESAFIRGRPRAVQRKLDRSSGFDAAEYHRGLADGLRGLGDGTPGDRSNLASDIYLALAIWWRYVERLESVTMLHGWLTRLLGAQQVGDKKRVEKICQRIGLTFRAPGRPPIIPTPPPLGCRY